MRSGAAWRLGSQRRATIGPMSPAFGVWSVRARERAFLSAGEPSASIRRISYRTHAIEGPDASNGGYPAPVKEAMMRRLVLLMLAAMLCLSGGLGVAAQNDATPALVEGNTAFALDLYAVLRSDTSGNLVVSPYSISQALAMTWAGAEGNTASQIASTLHFPLDEPALASAFQQSNEDLTTRGTAGADPDYGYPARSLQLANGLWGEQTFPFDPAFIDHLAEFYGAGLHPADFLHDPEGAREEINGWVAEHTGDKIQNIVPEGALTEGSRLVLANAVYFYGGWLETFDEDKTKDGEFTLVDGATITTPFMHQQAHFGYSAGDGYQVIELPYAGSRFAFTMIVPDAGQFDTVEQGLDTTQLTTAIAGIGRQELILAMPKFEFEYDAALADTLEALGMTDAFDPDLADFDGMLDASAPEPLVIGDVLHKAFIAVDENGTEAAAATAVLMAGAGAPAGGPLTVDIDRPFVFLIRDTETGTVLFMGRVMDPTS